MVRYFSVFRFASVALLACVTATAGQTTTTPAKQQKKKAVIYPAHRIPVSDLGYHEPLFERVVTGRFPVSLNFLAPDRLLFTFNIRELASREADHCDGPYDDDQMVRAAVVSLPDGHALAQQQWQLHDHHQYLWPVHDGILLRRCHEFDLLSDSLDSRRLLEFKSRPMRTEIAPDGRIIVVETQHEKHTPEEHERLMKQAIVGDGIIPPEDIDVNIISLETNSALAKAEQHAPIHLPVVHDGYFNAISAQKNHWLIVFQPFSGKPVDLMKIESNCPPLLDAAADDVVLAATCVSALNYHGLIAIDRQGKELWRDEWLNNLSRPVYAFAADNQTFAVATVHVLSSSNGFAPVTDSAARNEDITVYSTYKGEPLLSISISPPYPNGQNFALSSDGSQLAVLNQGAIELYDVPHKK